MVVVKCGPVELNNHEKRALSTVCVEIKPSVNDKNQESYFMCKGKTPIKKSPKEEIEEYGYPQKYRLNLEDHSDMYNGYFHGKNYLKISFSDIE